MIGVFILFKPKFIFNTFLDITPEFLEKNNIKALLLDVDNTLTVAHKSKVLRDGAMDWFKKMKDNNIKLIILSNAKSVRIKPFADSIGLGFVALSAKPLPFGYLRAVRKIKLKRKNIAMVGDQIFTDILGAKFLGIISILVTDITYEKSASFKIRRKLEKRILRNR